MSRSKLIATTAMLLLGAGAFVYLKPGANPAVPAAAEPTHADLRVAPALPVRTIDLAAAVRDGQARAEFRTNGREHLRVDLTNTASEPIAVEVAPGQLFQNDRATVIVTRAAKLEIKPGETATADLSTAATVSTNKVEVAACQPAGGTLPKLGGLLAYVQSHPEISTGAIQTAVFALTENLPLSALAKFSQPGDIRSQFDTAAFKAETSDIIAALQVLRDIGISADEIALTVDPQLKIEAMIDPLAHAAAMQYYGISPETEWEYWKKELLNGDSSTRHYALFGIARYYPEVALQMLPAWVREARTQPVFRTAAVQALAETQRSEALSVLRQLEFEMGAQTELGRAIRTAADFLDSRLNKTTVSKAPVQFRASNKLPDQQAAASQVALPSAAG